jgi:hypothetical protein
MKPTLLVGGGVAAALGFAASPCTGIPVHVLRGTRVAVAKMAPISSTAEPAQSGSASSASASSSSASSSSASSSSSSSSSSSHSSSSHSSSSHSSSSSSHPSSSSSSASSSPSSGSSHASSATHKPSKSAAHGHESECRTYDAAGHAFDLSLLDGAFNDIIEVDLYEKLWMKGEEGFFLAIFFFLSLSLSFDFREAWNAWHIFLVFFFLVFFFFSFGTLNAIPFRMKSLSLSLSFGFLFVTLSFPCYAVRVLFGAYLFQWQGSN